MKIGLHKAFVIQRAITNDLSRPLDRANIRVVDEDLEEYVAKFLGLAMYLRIINSRLINLYEDR